MGPAHCSRPFGRRAVWMRLSRSRFRAIKPGKRILVCGWKRCALGKFFDMDILPLLDELRTIALNGLNYTENPYDRERYERLLALASQYYGQAVNLPPEEARQRLAAELGYVTPKVGADG